MKKLTKLLALTASLLAFTFIGCNTSVDDATISGGELKETKTLAIYATSKDDVITFNPSGNVANYSLASNARTITPVAVDGTEQVESGTNRYTFKLSGKNLTTDETLKKGEATKFTVDFVANTGSTTEGVVNVDLDVANYELTLEVEDSKVDGDDKVILSAKAYADLRYNESIRFFLMPASGGTGKINLKLYLDNWDLSDYPGYEATARITKLDESVKVGDDYEKTVALKKGSANAVTFPATSQNLASGTYNFVVEFKNATTKKTFSWSDRIVVLKNQTTEQTIGIPLVIGKIPAQPVKLYAGYKVPSKDDALYYQAEFNWEDKSDNEQNFQLDLLDISDVDDTASIADATGDFKEGDNAKKYSYAIEVVTKNDTADDTKKKHIKDAWDILAKVGTVHNLDNTIYQVKDTNQEGGITFAESTVTNENSSLAKNSEKVLLNLPLGKRYLARISSVNDAGNSEYTYAEIAPSTDYAGFTFGAVSWPAKSTCINVYKIAYNLVGGAFYDATYPTDTTITPSTTDVTDKIKTTSPTPTTLGGYTINKAKDTVIQYDCQSTATTNAVILNPLKVTYETSKTAALFKGKNKWVSWKKESTTSSNIFRTTSDTGATLEAYKGFENLFLYAAYSSATAKIYNPADYIIKAENLIMKTGSTETYSAATATFANGGTIAIGSGATAKKYLFILVENDEKYTNVQIQLKETNGTIVGTYKSTGTTTVDGTTSYDEVTTNPGTFDDLKDQYFKDNSGTAFTDASEWDSASKWYKKNTSGSKKYETFVIPTFSVKTTSFQATIQAYAGITTETPYTYPVIFTITE